MKLYICAIFCFLTSVLPAYAKPTPADAEKLYKAGKYTEAVLAYDSIMKSDGTSAQLLFNMGNAYVKSDKLGAAMVCYQQAHALAPSNSTINDNIEYISGKIEDRNKAKLGGKNKSVTPDSPSFMKSVERKIASNVSADVWGYLAIASFIILLGGVALYIFTANVLMRKIGFFGALVFLALTVMFNVFTFVARSYWSQRNECVITSYEATILPSPNSEAKSEVTPLVEGTLLELIPEEDTPKGWVKVKLNSSFIGYLPENDVVAL